MAVKLLKPETMASESSSRKFLAEIDVLRACRDQHIVAFLGAWAHKASKVYSFEEAGLGFCLPWRARIVLAYCHVGAAA